VVGRLLSVDVMAILAYRSGTRVHGSAVAIVGAEFTLDNGNGTYLPPQQVATRDLNGLSIEFPRKRGASRDTWPARPHDTQ